MVQYFAPFYTVHEKSTSSTITTTLPFITEQHQPNLESEQDCSAMITFTLRFVLW